MDEFEVLQTLGRGSFGVVRKVRRKADGKTLVEKEMNYGTADEKQKEQIVAEVRLLDDVARCCSISACTRSGPPVLCFAFSLKCI